jgi:hypothetical protein
MKPAISDIKVSIRVIDKPSRSFGSDSMRNSVNPDVFVPPYSSP